MPDRIITRPRTGGRDPTRPCRGSRPRSEIAASAHDSGYGLAAAGVRLDIDARCQTPELLTGHGHVLVEIARHPESRVKDISEVAGLTERTTAAIIADLEAAGYLNRTRVGRRTRYQVNLDLPFRHQGQDGHLVGPFLDLLAAESHRRRPREDRKREVNKDVPKT